MSKERILTQLFHILAYSDLEVLHPPAVHDKKIKLKRN